MLKRTSNNQTQTSDEIVWFVSTGFVARTAKPHVDKGRVCSEEHTARGAHELSAFIYQVDCIIEGAQFLKHSHPFPTANRFHEQGIRQIGAATEAQKVPSTTLLLNAQQEPAMTTFVVQINPMASFEISCRPKSFGEAFESQTELQP